MSASIFECTSCGACCATYRVSFYWSDGAHLPERMVEQVTPTMACMAGTGAASPRCAALQGRVGERVRCAVYAQRPPVCRDVVPGDARCIEARRRHGLGTQNMREARAWVCFDWGGTLMSEEGPLDVPMGLWPEVRALEGARETLEALGSRYGIALATNATVSDRPMIERALARVDLVDFIDEVFCFTEIGWRKDSRRFWDVVMQATGAGADRIVMVGDTLEQDVLGPRESGIASIWFNEGGRHPPPVRPVPTATRLADVVPLVDAILRPT